jgi:hypothetical protein
MTDKEFARLIENLRAQRKALAAIAGSYRAWSQPEIIADRRRLAPARGLEAARQAAAKVRPQISYRKIKVELLEHGTLKKIGEIERYLPW